MKITARGQNRATKTHLVAETQINIVRINEGKLAFTIDSSDNPGIGSGQFSLFFEMDKREVDMLYEASSRIYFEEKIEQLQEELSELKYQLSQIG